MIKTVIYLHANKEDMWYEGEELGLNEKQLQNFRYVDYEIPISIEVLMLS